MEVTRVGLSAVRVAVGSSAEALRLAAAIRASPLAADEVIPGARTVVLDGVDPQTAELLLGDLLATRRPPAGGVGPGAEDDLAAGFAGPMVELPTSYGGEDLPRVAELWGCSVEEVVARHTSLTFTSAFCGFAPGFAYLSGLPEGWRVPRLAEPRVRVPAGSVAIAGEWCGVYPVSSPGGWLLLGHTDATLWEPSADSPALLAPGTRIRFTVAG